MLLKFSIENRVNTYKTFIRKNVPMGVKHKSFRRVPRTIDRFHWQKNILWNVVEKNQYNAQICTTGLFHMLAGSANLCIVLVFSTTFNNALYEHQILSENI
jgi:hypothetical protein